METILSVLTPLLMFTSSLFGGGEQSMSELQPDTASPTSVELGLLELSPKGIEGGYAMPASGCSTVHTETNPNYVHECSTSLPIISVDDPIVRLGEDVIVHWDPNGNVNCILSLNLAPNNGNIEGDQTVTPTGETSFSIVCAGPGNTDSVSVKVLPRIQET